MSEPTTEAGKRLLTEFWREDGDGVTADAILVIEAEARRSVLTTLRERVEGLLSLDELHADGPDALYDRKGREVAWPELISRAAVLAEIDRLMAEDKPEEGAS